MDFASLLCFGYGGRGALLIFEPTFFLCKKNKIEKTEENRERERERERERRNQKKSFCQEDHCDS